MAGKTPVLVHNSCGDLHFPGSSIDDATQRQVTDLVDIYDANGGRLPGYIARGGGPEHVFRNNQGLLPSKPDGYYREADVGLSNPTLRARMPLGERNDSFLEMVAKSSTHLIITQHS